MQTAKPEPTSPDIASPSLEKTVLRRSRADEVYEALKRDIANFKLVPGDRFTENAVTEQLKVSRTPVRQALTRLQQEGYVEVSFRSGWRVLPFDFAKFEQLYDLRMVLETTAAQRLCEEGSRSHSLVNRALIDALMDVWLVSPEQRSTDTQQVSQWDEDFHCALVAAAGNLEIARVHREVTERIRIIRRLDFTQQARIDATYDEHGKILNAIRAKRSDQAVMLLRAHIETSQAEVKKITIHQFHMARQDASGSVVEKPKF